MVAGYEGVTTAAALDMQSGVALDPMAEFKALGTHPAQGDTPAVGVVGLTLSVQQAEGKAGYAPRCTDTDAVGMTCERITGQLTHAVGTAYGFSGHITDSVGMPCERVTGQNMLLNAVTPEDT